MAHPAASAPPPARLLILFGSETGTAQVVHGVVELMGGLEREEPLRRRPSSRSGRR
jgi:hypothetical protein